MLVVHPSKMVLDAKKKKQYAKIIQPLTYVYLKLMVYLVFGLKIPVIQLQLLVVIQ